MKPSRLLSSAFVVLMIVLAVTVLLHGMAPAAPNDRARMRAADASDLPDMTAGNMMLPAKASDRAAAIASIQAQLKAFARDDYQTAVGYQSAELKRNFPSTEAFRSMMQRAYPEFAHYKSAQFGKAQAEKSGRHLAILVTLIGQDGVTVKAVYLMVREGSSFRVAGVAGGAQAAPFDNDNGPITPGREV